MSDPSVSLIVVGKSDLSVGSMKIVRLTSRRCV